MAWAVCAVFSARGSEMRNPLDSLWGTIICGVLMTVVLYLIVRAAIGH